MTRCDGLETRAGGEPLDPTVVIGRSGLFDRDFYLSANPDVAAAGVDPVRHYLEFGAGEFRNPSTGFDTWFYSRSYPEVSRQPARALLHYLEAGQAEGRAPRDPQSVVLSWTPSRDAGAPSFEKPVAVHVHLFYPELLQEITTALLNLPIPYDLWCSVCSRADQFFVERWLEARLPGVRSEVRILPNRGRDIAPFLLGFADVWPSYDLVCHLHSKRSRHISYGDYWRREILNRLFGSPELAVACLAYMRSNPDCGLLFPENIRQVKPFVSWGQDPRWLESLFRRLDVRPGPLPRAPDFAAGSMGWFRPAALKPVFSAGLQLEEFEPEEGQLDGTLAHSFERAFPAVVRAAEYRSVTYYVDRSPQLAFGPVAHSA